MQIWTFGVNDEGALGRVTTNVPNPEEEGTFLDVDELTSVPHPITSLQEEKFRAVKVIAGDSISAAISLEGELRVWGSFRVRENLPLDLPWSADSNKLLRATKDR